MKRENREVSGDKEGTLGHDINRMLCELRCPMALQIDPQIQLKPVSNPDKERKASQAQINQVLRYGMVFHCNEVQSKLAGQFSTIMGWIDGELR